VGEKTAITWTDATFNPWIGCARVSPGCQHCYAEALTKRTGMAEWGVNGTRTRTSVDYWKQPLRWNKKAAAAGRPTLVFCASLADVFEDRDDVFESRSDLFELIEATPNLIWQLLTKRPENVLGLVPSHWLECIETTMMGSPESTHIGTWPSNVWIGTTVEDQQRADERIPVLLDIPAPVRFASFEPLLGPVTLQPEWLTPSAIVCGRSKNETEADRTAIRAVLRAASKRMGGRYIDWGIVGGESGAGFRPLNLDHARGLVDQLQRAVVPTLFKQVGGYRPDAGGHELDGRTFHEFPPEAQR
jgi:protein gp37